MATAGSWVYSICPKADQPKQKQGLQQGKGTHAPPQHFQDTAVTGVKDLGRDQYMSLIQQCHENTTADF